MTKTEIFTLVLFSVLVFSSEFLAKEVFFDAPARELVAKNTH